VCAQHGHLVSEIPNIPKVEMPVPISFGIPYVREFHKAWLMLGRTERKEMTSLGHFSEGPGCGAVEKADRQ